MSNDQTGLVFFNEGNRAGAIVTDAEGVQHKLFGNWDESSLELSDRAGNSLLLKRVVPQSERHPVARGVMNVGGVGKSVVAFVNQLEDGGTCLGLAESTPPAERVDVPWA